MVGVRLDIAGEYKRGSAALAMLLLWMPPLKSCRPRLFGGLAVAPLVVLRERNVILDSETAGQVIMYVECKTLITRWWPVSALYAAETTQD